jgi:hypothetical protein
MKGKSNTTIHITKVEIITGNLTPKRSAKYPATEPLPIDDRAWMNIIEDASATDNDLPKTKYVGMKKPNPKNDSDEMKLNTNASSSDFFLASCNIDLRLKLRFSICFPLTRFSFIKKYIRGIVIKPGIEPIR